MYYPKRISLTFAREEPKRGDQQIFIGSMIERNIQKHVVYGKSLMWNETYNYKNLDPL